jgi:hypothetical protein
VDSRAAGTDKGTRKCKFEIDRLWQWNGIRRIRIRANRQCIGFLQSTPELYKNYSKSCLLALDSRVSALGSNSLAGFFDITGPICARSAN